MDNGYRNTFFMILVLVVVANCCFIMKRGAQTIECSSKHELSFKFINDITNETRIIAECHPPQKVCYLTENENEDNYIIANTSHGGLLVVRTLNKETLGTYVCFETFNHTKLDTVVIREPDADTKPPNIYLPEAQEKTADTGKIVLKKMKAMKADAFIPIECSSNTHITFQRIVENTSETVNIAQCQTTEHSCYLRSTMEDNYLITPTSSGGLLTVISVNEFTDGTYRCCETLNPSNCENITVRSQKSAAVLRTSMGQTIQEGKSVQAAEHVFDSGLTGLLKFCLTVVGLYVIILIIKEVIKMILLRNEFKEWRNALKRGVPTRMNNRYGNVS